jgi:hypothetical protein
VKTDGNEQAAFCGGLQLIEVQLAELSVDLFLMAANVHYWTHMGNFTLALQGTNFFYLLECQND